MSWKFLSWQNSYEINKTFVLSRIFKNVHILASWNICLYIITNKMKFEQGTFFKIYVLSAGLIKWIHKNQEIAYWEALSYTPLVNWESNCTILPFKWRNEYLFNFYFQKALFLKVLSLWWNVHFKLKIISVMIFNYFACQEI